MVALDLLPKSTSAVTCRQFFRKILEFSSHWCRVGKTTCHLFTCRNCGTGKMRAHRLWAADPRRHQFIVDELTATARLTIRYSAPCDSLEAYRARIAHDVTYVRALWRQLRRKFHGSGFIRSVELDPRRQDVIFRIYYVGEEFRYAWLAKHWQRILTELPGGRRGVQALTDEYKSCWENGADALRWTLDSLTDVLMLRGPERAQWEKAFEGFRLTASVGVLRGAKLDAEIELIPLSDDPDAPFGRCPCGCGGAVVKSDHHEPMTLTQLSTQYEQVDIGPLRDYAPYRPKVEGTLLMAGKIATVDDTFSHAPPT
jgi:hypothetical protein